ncbi:MAG: YdeI/OmpD-associated family protein [Pirellula sp.]
MTIKPLNVDDYLKSGCGRCPLGGTDQCKVHRWKKELGLLREILRKSGLVEEIKWSVPCYTHEGSNIAIVAAFKEYCSVSFFKGAGLRDSEGVLDKPGENSNSVRIVRVTSVAQIKQQRKAIESFILQAIDLERVGYKPPKAEVWELERPDELVSAFEEDPQFRDAFEALTPGRQRGYLLYFSAAKQSKTRVDRIEKHRHRILEGLGLHD